MNLFHLSERGGNGKVGMIPVSTSHSRTCPDACPLKRAGCYAESGYLRMHWDRVDSGERGVTWEHFLRKVRALARGVAFRHNQAGDLVGQDNIIDRQAGLELAEAARHTRCWTYTHYPPTPENAETIRLMNGRITVNVSTNNLDEADAAKVLGLPTVVVVPMDATSGMTPAGNRLVVCPEQTHGITCDKCMLCYRKTPNRPIVGFRVHGSSKHKLQARVGELAYKEAA